MTEEFDKIIDKMFNGEGEIGRIDCELAVRNVIIPAIETTFNNWDDEKLKNLLSKFICNIDNSTLYDVLKNRIAKGQYEERLKKLTIQRKKPL